MKTNPLQALLSRWLRRPNKLARAFDLSIRLAPF
jgi:hypothetical protein